VTCFCQGISYDHVELNFYVNGQSANARFTGIRGTVYPVIYGTCEFVPISL